MRYSNAGLAWKSSIDPPHITTQYTEQDEKSVSAGVARFCPFPATTFPNFHTNRCTIGSDPHLSRRVVHPLGQPSAGHCHQTQSACCLHHNCCLDLHVRYFLL